MSDLFPGFETRRVEGADGVRIQLRLGGAGPGLLLLHGYPQTHVIWHRIAARGWRIALRSTARGGGGLSKFSPAALAEYERCFADPRTIHATCEDDRAAASIDLVHGQADAEAGRRVDCPLLAIRASVAWSTDCFVRSRTGRRWHGR